MQNTGLRSNPGPFFVRPTFRWTIYPYLPVKRLNNAIMKKFIAFLQKICRRADYLLHHVAAEDIALLAFAILVHCLPWGWAMLAADGAAVFALLLKEVYDYFHPDSQSVELMDIESGLLAIAYVDVIIAAIFLFL